MDRARRARLEAMAEEATVDCYHESEQLTGFFTTVDENLAVPFETQVLGVSVVAEPAARTGSTPTATGCAERGTEVTGE